MKKQCKRIVSLVMALAIMAICLAGCNSSGESTSGSTTAPISGSEEEVSTGEAGVMKVASVIEGAMDKTSYPWFNPGGIALQAMYRTLLLADADLTTVNPDLAESYKISEDGLVYTFTLKDGLKWSDGEDLTAEDVKYSIETVLKTAGCNAIFTNAFNNISGVEAWKNGEADELTGVQIDGNTIVITLDAAYGAFLPVIAQFVILPEHATSSIDPLELNNDEYWANPVTSGAFKLGEMSAGNYFTLVPNEYYEGTPWKITKIINYFVPDLITAAQAGNTYWVNTNAPEIISELEKLDYMTMYPIDILFYRYFICNMEGVDGNENPVMQNPKVREAIMYAIDRETLATQLFPDQAFVINSGVPNNEV